VTVALRPLALVGRRSKQRLTVPVTPPQKLLPITSTVVLPRSDPFAFSVAPLYAEQFVLVEPRQIKFTSLLPFTVCVSRSKPLFVTVPVTIGRVVSETIVPLLIVRLLKKVVAVIICVAPPLNVIVPAVAVIVPLPPRSLPTLNVEVVVMALPDAIVILKLWFESVVEKLLALAPEKLSVQVPPPHAKVPAVLVKLPATEIVLPELISSVLPEQLIVRLLKFAAPFPPTVPEPAAASANVTEPVSPLNVPLIEKVPSSVIAVEPAFNVLLELMVMARKTQVPEPDNVVVPLKVVVPPSPE